MYSYKLTLITSIGVEAIALPRLAMKLDLKYIKIIDTLIFSTIFFFKFNLKSQKN